MNIPPPSSSLDLCVFLIHSLSLAQWGLNAYIFGRRQKSEWHTVMHQSQSSDMVIKSLFLSISTGLSKHKHTHTQVATYTTEQHKQKALFDKSHQPKHSLYSPLSVAALYAHSNSIFSLVPLCPRLCVRPIVVG